jgi:hypothetical protein
MKKPAISQVFHNIIGRHADALIMNLSIKTRGIFYESFVTFWQFLQHGNAEEQGAAEERTVR